jgi:hypothetical protein
MGNVKRADRAVGGNRLLPGKIISLHTQPLFRTCFTPFRCYAHCQFIQLLNFRSLVFGLTSLGRLRFITPYLQWQYFLFTPFLFTSTFSGIHLGVKQGLGVLPN